jgi:hypothetical protein
MFTGITPQSHATDLQPPRVLSPHRRGGGSLPGVAMNARLLASLDIRLPRLLASRRASARRSFLPVRIPLSFLRTAKGLIASPPRRRFVARGSDERSLARVPRHSPASPPRRSASFGSALIPTRSNPLVVPPYRQGSYRLTAAAAVRCPG